MRIVSTQLEAKDLLNTTSHPVMYRIGETDLIIPPSFFPSRVVEKSLGSERYTAVDSEGNPVLVVIEIVETELADLPDPKPGLVLIASTPVAQKACRPDVIAPDTYRAALRDRDRKIIGVTRFKTFVK